ncbi:2-hydroxychromene-2-carboxylate isomerase [Ferruginivarius sediminum]|uniref:2-hydroxychromene-2-carboxylate isomerase n=1 Tax=Ferruginivarius sediminum TaxID=2661937 RepID=A0A369TC13_9PROT|nr:2-hydroxychromene-2-carboxylate isomerase [Ferruginivarius sediminum]RDD62820.1 2-hydroxychromene-2-carboxylate isomerase [Ferruginivarius sediminum]
MSRTIDYYFFVISPFAYLGSQELERIVREHGVQVNVKPIEVKTVFGETGGVPPAKRPKVRQDYRFVELRRWHEARGLPLNLEPAHFPVLDALAAGAIIAAGRNGSDSLTLAHALLRACWAEERDISDAATVGAVADAVGLDGAALVEQARKEDTQAEFQRVTREAIDRGVFGSPWYVVDGEPFWGQDRLDFVERKLAGPVR